MAVDDFGTPQFSLNDCKVATWNSTDSYGTAVDVASVKITGFTVEMLSGRLEGDDKITAVAARAIAGELQLRFGGVRIAALEVIMGNSATSSVASPNQVITFPIAGGDEMPYFGIVGKALAEEDDGDFLVFLPKVKITSNITLARLEYGQFAIPEVTALAVPDTTYGIGRLVERQTATTITVPPADIS